MSRNLEDPFITGMRQNLNEYNANAEQRLLTRARRAKRRRITTRVIIAAIAVTLGLATGTALAQITEAEAATQQQINRFIRANDGIPPCKWEDGSGQPGPCVWFGRFGNGTGPSYIAMPDGPDKDNDKDIVFLTGPKAERY